MRFSHPLSKFGAGSAPPFHFCAPQVLPAGGEGRGRRSSTPLVTELPRSYFNYYWYHTVLFDEANLSLHLNNRLHGDF
jgi:hypothetical protein